MMTDRSTSSASGGAFTTHRLFICKCDLAANATSPKSSRQWNREVNSIGRRQLSPGSPTPSEDEHQAQITAALHSLFTSLQQRPFWRAGGGTCTQNVSSLTLIFREHDSSHTSGTSQNSAGQYGQNHSIFQNYIGFTIYNDFLSCTSGC